MAHKMQENRFELKYIIDEKTAEGVRNFVSPYLVPDEFADPNNKNSYMIHSLYCDNPGLALRQATVAGHKNRYKLRIRFYDEKPENPVFFEIKGRVNDVILKERAAVKRASVARILNRPYPERSDLLKFDAKNWATLERFCHLKTAMHATGHVFVSYLREAYVSPYDDSVRVTFDRMISASQYHKALNVKFLDSWLQPPVEGVVLELKFTDRFPLWMRDLVHSYNLWRGSMAKYVFCAESLNRFKQLDK
jgi:SPX domain protein involved in polyphosphate accumulation